jgi:ADP-ribose pyrophosphatase YjhB (NUDIX family)
MSNETARLTKAELDFVAATLKKLQPGFLPYVIFQEIARLTALPIVEVVPVRQVDNGRIQVLLTQREPDDALWPAMWHNPGTVIRATDEAGNYVDAMRRIFSEELDLAVVPELHFVTSFLHKTRRGTESTQIYWTELNKPSGLGNFFDAAALPSTTIGSHIEIIQLAVKAYQESIAGN